MNRFRGTKLFVIAVLCLQPLAAPRADDCNGQSYDPSTQVCCTDSNGQPLVVDGATCPAYCTGDNGVVPYNPNTHSCCSGVVYETATQSCCPAYAGGQHTVVDGTTCPSYCVGSEGPVPYNANTQGCCNGVVYDLATQICCGDVVVPIGQCCSNIPFNPDTQTCCTDGHIADIGQCDPPPLCNNEPFDQVTQECCAGMIVPLGHCCNGANYDPSWQGCCSGQVYSLASQICCGGVVHDKTSLAGGAGCCNGQVYDINLSGLGCCNGQFYTLGTAECCGETVVPAGYCCGGVFYNPETTGCCGGLLYDLATQDCCGGGVTAPKGQCGWLDCDGTSYNPATHGCCEGQLYELATQECCGGVAVVSTGGCCNGTPLQPGQGCCGTDIYDTMTHTCCGGLVVLKEYCCNDAIINPEEQGCCQGQVYARNVSDCCTDGRVVPSGQCGWPLCGGNPYDESTHGCCNGQTYPLATHACCHGVQSYETGSQTCCEGGAVVALGESCPQPPQPCGTGTYDPNLGQGCCNGHVFWVSSQCCVNGEVVSMNSNLQCPQACGSSSYDPLIQCCIKGIPVGLTSMGQCPSPCGNDTYDPAFFDCCGSTVIPTGSPCCNGVPYDTASHVCCGDGSVAPIGQCDWPICGGHRYDPNSGLQCCNGQTYDPNTQLCCDGTTVVDIGWCHPSLCNGYPFDPGESECCNNDIVAKGSCCAGQLITPGTQGCCGDGASGQPYLLATHGCSGGQIYNKSTHKVCPDGRIIPIEADCDWTSTCNGIPYNNMTHECCPDGTIAAIGQCPQPPQLCGDTPYDPDTQGCCNGHIYTKSSQECCGDGLILPPGQCGWPRCNGEPYDPEEIDCCGSFTAPKGQCPTCGGEPYDNITTGCCDGIPYNLFTQGCCISGIIYDLGVEECCDNGAKAPLGACPPVVPPKCNGETYDTTITGCCDNMPYPLASDECCYGEIVPIGQCPALTVNITSSCPPPCFVSTNQTIEVNVSSSGALGTVTYSWNFGGATGSATEGPGPITVNFTNITTGGYVAIEVAATDTFQRHDQPFARGASFTTNATVFVARILADTNRDGSISDADEDGKNAAPTKERGALIPPGQLLGSNNHPNILNGLAPLQLICGPTLEPGDKLVLTKLDDPDKNLQIVDASSAGLLEFKDGKQEFTRETLTNNPLNLLMGSACARNSNTNRFSLKLAFVRGGQTLVSDEVKVGIAPIILPWECATAQKTYSTRTNIVVPNIEYLNVDPTLTFQWTQDMVKFGKVQCSSNSTTDVFVDLNHLWKGDIADAISNQVHIARVPLDYRGNGGNIMVAPPFGGYPVGKVFIGSNTNDETHANEVIAAQFWEAQGVQPVDTSLDTSWLHVGHLDEVIMFVSANQVLVADPWKAADLLHEEIAANRGAEKLWREWSINSQETRIDDFVIAKHRTTLNTKSNSLLQVLTANMSAITNEVFSTVFEEGDFIRADNEIMKVLDISNGIVTLERGVIEGRPAAQHNEDTKFYAYSAEMTENLGLTLSGYGLRMKLAAFRNGLPSAFAQIPMPVLFGHFEKLPENRYVATTSNTANGLVTGGGIYYFPDTHCTKFNQYVQAALPGAQPVDVWNEYHCKSGEIHCGTASQRTLPLQLPWWRQINDWE